MATKSRYAHKFCRLSKHPPVKGTAILTRPQLYEQSRFANETGAAVHLAPNSNGVLRRWGIFAEEFGAVSTDRIQERGADGTVLKDMDIKGPNRMWQHPWLLSHRVSLHEKLKALATEAKGEGLPAKLHTSSKVVGLDPEKGEVSLVDGTVVKGDVILGADGIYVSLFLFFFFGFLRLFFILLPPLLTSRQKVQNESLHQRRKIVWVWKGGFPFLDTAQGLP